MSTDHKENSTVKMIKVLSLLLLNCALLFPLLYAAESGIDRLVNLLAEKGMITKEEAADLRTDLAVKTQDEKKARQEFPVIAACPVRITGYTQILYRQEAADGTVDGFSVRRARLDLKGNVAENFDYGFQADFAGASVRLLDATISYAFNPYLKTTFGQFRIPFSQENLAPNSKLDTINRSRVVETLVSRSKDVIGSHLGRDIGFQASGSAFEDEGSHLVEYAAGVFNGAGINTSDTNELKDFAGRAVIHPVKAVAIGGSYYTGTYTLAAAPTELNGRTRTGGEFAFIRGNVAVKGEYIQGTDAAVKKDGWYTFFGYHVLPKRFQVVVKYDRFDPDMNATGDETSVHTYGFNWFLARPALFQVNYERKKEFGTEIKNDTLSGQFTLQF